MPNLHDLLSREQATLLDRRAALRVYVPPTLAAIGLVTRTSHGLSGSGGDPHPDPSSGHTTAPRDHTGVTRQSGRGRKRR
jgi:hypothetical protein